VRLDEVDVRIEGAGHSDESLREIVAKSPLQHGARLEHPAYESLKSDLLRRAQAIGYLDAKITRRELDVDPAARAARAAITLETGGRYEFGALLVEQDAIDEDLLAGFLRFAPGQPFTSEALRNTQYALEDSSYFANVSIETGERDAATLTVPVTIRATGIRRHRYSVRLGYGTDTSVRGKFSWENRLVNRQGHRWQIETTASAILQEAVARYVVPVGDPTLEKLEFSGGYTNEDIGDLDSERFELTAGLTQVLGRWQRVLFLKLNRENTDFPDSPTQSDLLLIPGISFASLPPNFLTGWVRDAAYFIELSGSPSTLGSDASYLRLYGRAERIWAIGGPWHLRLRGELGTSWVDDFSELPASQRFFAGGDYSIRGFAINELSPTVTDSAGNVAKVGGEHLLVGSVEIEHDLPRNFRATAFADFGNAFNDWDTPLEYSVGVGVRWRLPMLMIGLDVAQALSEPDKRPRIHLNITQVL